MRESIIGRFWNNLLSRYYSRQRKIDLQILWPVCLDQAMTLAQAKAIFAAHAYKDPAWLVLGEKQIFEIIDKLAPGVVDVHT